MTGHEPSNIVKWLNEGLALHRLGKLPQAKAMYEQILQEQSNHFDALQLLATAYRQEKNSHIALLYFDKALQVNQTNAAVFNNRGNALKDLKRLDEALNSYGEAIRLKPDYADAYSNLGNALQELKRLGDALKSYDEAIRLKPDYAEVYSNRGNTLKELTRLDEALKSYDEAIRLKPDYVDAHNNRGNVLQELKRFGEAVKSYDQALRLKPDYVFLFGTRLHTQMKLCDWTGLPEQLKQLDFLLLTNQKATVPFPLLALTDSPKQQLLAAQVYIEAKHPISHLLGDCVKRASDGKIRIGYYSSDFHDHAISSLTAELFEAHDATAFELYGFSYGPNTDDEMRKRVSKGLRHFVDVSERSDLEIAKMSRELGIDIAVNLNGFTQNARTDIFAMRCAPIQVNYLGYPGTMGASYIDYIVADPTLIPLESQCDYTEKIVYMPHSYQVNDSTREIANTTFIREELGLPETGFVFCCFNNSYKILPATFDRWMRLLTAVKGSVLWLLEDNFTAAINLRKEAVRRGVDASRLVFAKRMKLDEHLARHRVADLFIDTFPYNAHTTASDSLWAGLPVLTLMGESFASRVAASLLNALDLSELITLTPNAYEARAIELAVNPDMLEQIKAKLHRNRQTSPLFDGHTYAKHLEVAYSEMYSRYASGLSPLHITVQP